MNENPLFSRLDFQDWEIHFTMLQAENNFNAGCNTIISIWLKFHSVELRIHIIVALFKYNCNERIVWHYMNMANIRVLVCLHNISVWILSRCTVDCILCFAVHKMFTQKMDNGMPQIRLFNCFEQHLTNQMRILSIQYIEINFTFWWFKKLVASDHLETIKQKTPS